MADKEEKSPIQNAMIIMESDGNLGIEVLDEKLFEKESCGIQPTIEIRFTAAGIGDFIGQLNEEYRQEANKGMQGAFLFKRVGREYYILPCGNEKFMQVAEKTAKELGMAIVR